jgi:hypothetical protein
MNPKNQKRNIQKLSAALRENLSRRKQALRLRKSEQDANANKENHTDIELEHHISESA